MHTPIYTIIRSKTSALPKSCRAFKTPAQVRSYGLKSFFGIVLALALTACRPDAVIPADYQEVTEQAAVYPDYKEVVVPPNIAPLNILVNSPGDEYVAAVEGQGRPVVAAAYAGEPLQFDSLEWHKLLADNRGKDLRVSIYAKREGEWVRFPTYQISVAEEAVDRYLSYRLIEPSYELYRQLGLYQRDLQGFGVHTIYENNREYDNENNHCINCHNYQNNSTERMLFHVRAKHGGTVFVQDGKAEKVIIKADSILSGAVYPAWHPQRNWLVFSSNQTGQAFHMVNKQKIEVVDYGSDLIFYDADKHEFRNVLRTEADQETFPCWAPDGKKLYYCCATIPEFVGVPDSVRADIITRIYDRVRYNVMSMTFDPATRTFGAPVVEVDCASQGKSAAVPRVSPDGRYLLFTQAGFGQFHIWHQDADLYVKDLQTGEVRSLGEANSPRADSYHGWSSNGRWIVMASRRDDGSYSRPYLAYFDRAGKSHKAFLVPQFDPRDNIRLIKSYNVPELTKDAVRISAEELKECIYADDKAVKATYK